MSVAALAASGGVDDHFAELLGDPDFGLWIVDGEREQVLPVARKYSEDKDLRVRSMVERIIKKYEAAEGTPGQDVAKRAALPKPGVWSVPQRSLSTVFGTPTPISS